MYKLRIFIMLLALGLLACENEIEQEIDQGIEEVTALEIQTESSIRTLTDCHQEMRSRVGPDFEGTTCQVCGSYAAYPGETLTLYGVAFFHDAQITQPDHRDYNVIWTVMEGNAIISTGDDPRIAELTLPEILFDKVVIRLENLAPNGLAVSEVITIRNASAPIRVGDPGQAGRVMYDKGTNTGGWRYLEATNVLVGSNFAENRFEMEWGCLSEEIGTTGVAIGEGKSNAATIVNFMNDIIGYREDPDARCSGLNDGTVSAWAIDAYPNNGFSDWHLPSLEEAQVVAQNLGWLSEDPNKEEIMLIWTSSEADAGSAYAVDLYSGEIFIESKDTNLRAIGVRYF